MFAPVASDDAESPAIQTEDDRIAEFAAAAAHGSDTAFVELYGLISQRIFNMVLRSVHDRETAEDLCQEIWLKVHHEIGGLRAPEAVRSWLYRIASRACIDFARSSRATHSSDEELFEEMAQAYEPMPEDAAIQGSQVRMVWETLATMAPRQSIALYLKQVDGRSYEEIGSILNCSRETVESLLFRARQSFVRAYDRVQSSSVERCSMFQQVVASVVDNEPTQLQKGAIHAHMQECRPCRIHLPEMAAAAKGYGVLPLLPLTKGIAFQAILGGAAAGTAVGVGPAATGGVIAGLSLKAKLAALFSLLAVGATGATSTQVINVPLVPDIGGIFRDEATQDDQTLLVNGHDSSVTQQSRGNATGSAGATTSTGGADGAPGKPYAATRRDGASGADSGAGSGANGERPPASPVALASGPPGAGGSGGSGSSGDAGSDAGLTELLPPGSTPFGTLLQDPVGTLGGVVDGTLDDTLDTLLPPPDGDGPGPVEDLLDDVDDTLDDVLPGEDEEENGGLLNDILDPILGPGETPPPAGTPGPEATEPPGCVLIILC